MPTLSDIAGGATGAGITSAARRWVMTELRRDGQGQLVETPVRFVWDALTRTAPHRPWTFGKAIRSSRTDYPGQRENPSEQILGVAFKEFMVRGEWDDHYAGAGFADGTRRALESLLDRKNLVRIEFDGISITGIIKDLTFEVHRTDLIGYSFTFSPHYRVKDPSRTEVAAPQLKGPSDFADDLRNGMAAMAAAHAEAPAIQISGTLHSDVTAAIGDLTAKLDAIDAVITDRFQAGQDAIEKPIRSVTRLGQAFVAVQNSAQTLLTLIRSTRSDLSIAYETAATALSFEVWQRGLAAAARDMVVTSAQAAAEMRRRDKADVLTLYRPRKGESWYDVSQRFYGTPTRWREIQVRNGIKTLLFQGTELLIIPKVGTTS